MMIYDATADDDEDDDDDDDAVFVIFKWKASQVIQFL